VAKALLRDCFAAAQRAGRKAVLLHVDVANVTGALRLYESVGMRPVLEIDAFAKGTSSVDATPA
jgi:ribosomal protein S18 acetylase RimI-like enzyme